jgi:alpha-1,2-mannosyltransferase
MAFSSASKSVAGRGLRHLAPSSFALSLFLLAGANYALSRQLVDLIPRDWGRGTVRRVQKDFRFHEQGQDSWYPMAVAYERFLTGQGERLYDDVFFQGGVKFQYAPSALLFYRLMEWIDPRPVEEARQFGNLHAKLFGTWHRTFDEATWQTTRALLLASVGLLLAARWPARRTSQRDWPPARRWIDWALVGIAGWMLADSFYPVLRGYTLGQIQPFLTLLFALALGLWMAGQQAAAGALLGLACLAKPQFGLFLAWGLLRRRWGFSIAMSVVVALGLALSVALYGFGNHLDYLRVISHIARHGESFHPNQSVNGFLHRALNNGNNAEWVGDAFAPYHPLVYWGTLATSLALLAVALWPSREGRGSGGRFDFCLAALAFTMASPVAWEHHYGILLPIFAILAPAIAARAADQKIKAPWDAWLCAIAYLLTAHYFEFLTHFAGTPWTPLQSHLFFGALMVFGLLWRERSLSPAPQAPTPEAAPSETPS